MGFDRLTGRRPTDRPTGSRVPMYRDLSTSPAGGKRGTPIDRDFPVGQQIKRRCPGRPPGKRTYWFLNWDYMEGRAPRNALPLLRAAQRELRPPGRPRILKDFDVMQKADDGRFFMRRLKKPRLERMPPSGFVRQNRFICWCPFSQKGPKTGRGDKNGPPVRFWCPPRRRHCDPLTRLGLKSLGFKDGESGKSRFGPFVKRAPATPLGQLIE